MREKKEDPALAKYTPEQKAAILLMSFGEEISAELLKNMDKEEVLKITRAISRLHNVSDKDVSEVQDEFVEQSSKVRQSISGGSDVARRMINSAFPKGSGGFEGTSLRIDALDHADAATIATILGNEHPQTMALVLSHLEPKQAGDALKLLPEALRPQLISRIAQMTEVTAEIIEELNETLRQSLASHHPTSQITRGGVRQVAKLLTGLDREQGKELLSKLEERDVELANKIRDEMVVFDDIKKLSDKDLRRLMQEFTDKQWQIALRGVSQEIMQAFLAQKSERARQVFVEDMAASAKLPRSEVESVQRRIISKMSELAKDGTIVLVDDGEEWV